MEDALNRLAEAELEQSIVMVLRREPFYGHLLGSVVRRIDSTIPTAAVTLSPLGVSLVVNPRFFVEQLNREERCAVIKHEILHLVLRHLFRFEGPGLDRTQLNLAADLVVNQLVHPWPLPAGAITLSSFPELQLKSNKSVEHYYKALERGRRSSGFQALLQKLTATNHSHHGHWAGCGGEGFSVDSDPLATDAPSSAGGSAAPKLSEQLSRILEEGFNRQLQRARSRLTERQWGDVPGSIRALLEHSQAGENATINWKRTLRLFASAGYRTRVVATTRRPSRRFGTYPGVRIRRERKLAVVVDTSGSIGAEALVAFFAEIALIHRSGAEVVVIEADAAVQKVYPYKGRTPEQTEGGGGTDFNPAFRWLREESRQRFDGCIYLTDGNANVPNVRPPCRLLWVVTADGRMGDHLPWGKSIRIGG